MRIGIATVQVPFIRGGAEDLAEGLASALKGAGHEVDVIGMPFRFAPNHEVKRSMDIWRGEHFENINGYEMDRAICLKFPTYHLRCADKVVWLLHQHRSAYEPPGSRYADETLSTAEGRELRREIHRRDTESLQSCKRIYTIAARVSSRLKRHNDIDSTPLYHPPRLVDRCYTAEADPFIFYPSRLEDHKRQTLLIEAMRHVKTPAAALIAGGGFKEPLQDMIHRLDLHQKVRVTGRISDEELLACHARCLGVFFGPYDEDYGYVTLEAMLSSKPVISCTDSGGPLEFIVDGETGLVAEPEPEDVARAIDHLYTHRRRAGEMGRAGRRRYREMNISWDHVVEELTR